MAHIKDHMVTYAKHIPSPNRGRVITPRFIVMHYTAGFTADSAVNYFRMSSSRVSAQLVVETDGSVTQMVPYNVAAWHAGPSRHMGYSGLNNYSIGIEIVNAGWFRRDGDYFYRDNIRRHKNQMHNMIKASNPRLGSGDFWWPEYPEAQLASVEDLTKDIISAYNILDIVTHEEIDTRGWKTDPGPAFPMERYKRLMFNEPHRDMDGENYQVTASALNVRSGPGTNFGVMGQVHRGDLVEVVDIQGSWARLDQNDNSDGWVHTAYLRRF